MSVPSPLWPRHRAYSAGSAQPWAAWQQKNASEVAVVACMDSRLDVFAVPGTHPGNAMSSATTPAASSPDTIRSLAIASTS